MLNQMSGALGLVIARLPAKSAPYLCLFLAWGALLWFLSASEPSTRFGPEIPHFDKVLHFCYFAAGGSLLAAYLGLRWSSVTRWKLALMAAMICCVIGRLDEYHQGFVPGRSGNDTGDWLADTLGGFSGVWAVMVLVLPRMMSKMPKNPEVLEE